MRTTDLKELMHTVEALRQEMHPELDAGFLEQVIRAEEENTEDEGAAVQAIEAAMRALLKAKGVG